MILQQHEYDPKYNIASWKITFVQYSELPLTMEEYDEVSVKLDNIIEQIEARRMAVDSNNQHDK